MYILRFVNSIISSNVEKNVIWTHISSVRSNYLKQNITTKCYDFISNEAILKNFEILSSMVGNEGSEDVKYNISKSELNEAAKMYFCLNSCPSFVEKLYSKVIYRSDARIPMIASNILKRTEGGLKVKALKIFEKITSVLGFQYISYSRGERNIRFTKNNLEGNRDHKQ